MGNREKELLLLARAADLLGRAPATESDWTGQATQLRKEIKQCIDENS